MSMRGSTASSEPEPIDPVIPPADETDAATRPDNLGQTYKESECDAASQEQLDLAQAAADEEAGAVDIVAAQTERARQTAETLLSQAERTHIHDQEAHNHGQALLSYWVNRPDHAKLIYWLRLGLLLVGDVAGVSGAALLLGETYFNAFGQAVSAALAAVTLGVVGSETKRQVDARSRAAAYDGLGADYERYGSLFSSRIGADVLVRMVVSLAFLGMAFIVVAIFTLRLATEGAAAAWCFGLLAAAVGLASFINSYSTTSDVGEYLDRLSLAVHKSRKEVARCAKDPVIAKHDGSVKQSYVIRSTWAARGRAAWWARQREKFAILNANPRTVGNGENPDRRRPGNKRLQRLDDGSDEQGAA